MFRMADIRAENVWGCNGPGATGPGARCTPLPMPLNFRTLDLNLLRVFDAVMAEGSLTRAAGALSMTQPAVSHALKRLREAVGEELFVRSAYGMKPTPLAESIWPTVRQALFELRQALAPGDFDPRRDAVQLRIALADSTAAMLAPALVQAIEREAAQVNLRLLPLTTRDPRRLLDDNAADLAIGFFPEVLAAITAQGRDGHLRHARLYDTRYRCVMRRGHPLAEAPLTLDAYCAAHHLLVSFSGRPHGAIDEALAALGRQRRILLTVNQFYTAARVVASSDLLTVLPEGFLQSSGLLDRQALVARDVPLALGPVHVEMVWHLRHDAAPAHRWLRQQLLAATALATAGPAAPA
jgi:DNA-binding transcriptional LysR family regulator